MTVRPIVLAMITVLCLSPGSPAQVAAPPPGPAPKPPAGDYGLAAAEGEQGARLRQMQEDIGVFRALFNRTAARYYNFPATRETGMAAQFFQASHADLA